MRIQMHSLMRVLMSVLVVPLSGKAAVVEAVRTHAVPKIDGKLDDACWKTAKPITTFLIKDSESPSQSLTVARMTFGIPKLQSKRVRQCRFIHQRFQKFPEPFVHADRLNGTMDRPGERR